MEKSQIPKIRLQQSKPYPKPSLSPEPKSSRPAVWDCGSTLYDSFERTSFQRHLDSAITATSARSLSMPHRTDLRVFPAPSRAAADTPTTPRSKLSRSFQKLLRSVFSHGKSKNADSGKETRNRGIGDRDGKLFEKESARWFVVYEEDDGVGFEKDRREKGAALTTIAEAPETENKAGVMSPEVVKKSGVISPEIGAAVRKTMSERFTAASVNRINAISSCA
ncbi:hypothetical protein V2J09_014627 [Rumex salicifolius]